MAEDDRGFLGAARLQLLQPLHGIMSIVIIMVIMKMIKIIIIGVGIGIGIVYCGWSESAHPPRDKDDNGGDDDDDDDGDDYDGGDDDDHCCSSKDEERQGRIPNTQSSDERGYKASNPEIREYNNRETMEYKTNNSGQTCKG